MNWMVTMIIMIVSAADVVIPSLPQEFTLGFHHLAIKSACIVIVINTALWEQRPTLPHVI